MDAVAIKEKALSAIKSFGLPRLIITGFLLLMFVIAPFADVNIAAGLTNVFTRFGMNAVLVLAMVPMVHSGCGLNFGLPLGIISGLLGATMSVEFAFTGFAGFLMAIVLASPFAIILGAGYGVLLNRVKGGEMMIATPYDSPAMVWGYAGTGLRTTISVADYYGGVLDNFLRIQIGHFAIPTGAILFFAFLALLIWLFLRTKTGTAMTAVGSNPVFARASGVNVDRMRMLSVILSTWLGAVGIIVYEQSFGFIQLYMGPFNMAMPAVSAVLLGGASVNKASIANVVIGTLLFQGILTMTPSVMNGLIQTDVSEVIRIIVSNGMILYALTRKQEVTR